MFKTASLIILITLVFSVHIYLYIRGWQALSNNSYLRILFTTIFLIIILSVGLSFLLNNNNQTIVGYYILYLRGYWIFMALFILSFALLADFLRSINYLTEIFPAWIINKYSLVKLSYFFSVLTIAIIIVAIGSIKFSNPKTVGLELSFDRKNKCFENMNIVAASDLHIGALIHKGRLSKWISLINKQNPDIILLVGDIFDRSFSPGDSEDIIIELRKLRSKYGVYAVLGNHEYHYNIKKSIIYLEQAGITLLRDKSITVDNRLVIIGRDDAYGRGRKTIDSLISGVDFSLPVIMMDHQPYDLNGAVRNNIDLYISGHTHNGQIFPGNILYGSLWQLPYGYRKIENTHLYVSSGLGLIYIPLRLGTQSEIVRILLKRENEMSLL